MAEGWRAVRGVSMKRAPDWVSGKWAVLLGIQDSPHAIALGFAIGMFWGFTPLYGLKTMLTLVAAFVLRANKVAAVLSVSLHDVLLPVLPFVFERQYRLGERLLEAAGLPVVPHRFHAMPLHELLSWTTFVHVGEPLLVGSIAFGLGTGPLFYLAARWLVGVARRPPAGTLRD